MWIYEGKSYEEKSCEEKSCEEKNCGCKDHEEVKFRRGNRKE